MDKSSSVNETWLASRWTELNQASSLQSDSNKHSETSDNQDIDTTTITDHILSNVSVNQNIVTHSTTWNLLLTPPTNQNMFLIPSANQNVSLTPSTNQDMFLNTSVTHSSSLNLSANNTTYWCWNQSAQPHDEDFYEFYETSQFITGLILYPCICIPGLLGNILTLLVLSHRNMRTSTNAFLSALAVADSIKLINDLLYFCTILLLRTDDIIGNRAYGYLYPYAHFIFNMSVCVSSWLTVSVAVERYILVCHPTRARYVCNRGRAVMVCVGVFFIMSALALPSALRYKTMECTRRDTLTTMLQVELTDLWQDQVFVLGYNWTQNLLRSIIPLIVLVVLNTCIIGAVRKTRANRKNTSRHRVTMMMVIVILVFLVCITPDAIMSTVFGLGYTEANHLVRGIREFTDTLLAINAATNFIIYCLFNRVFLDGCKSVFCSKSVTVSKKWQTELDESQYKRLSEGLKSMTTSHTNHLNNNSENDESSPGL